MLTGEGDLSSLSEMREKIDKDEKIYLLDIDGINRNRPNLCLYSKISEIYNIWVDGGPRALGDIVDTVMAGATSITVRKKLWPNLDVASIREITESGIYTDINTVDQKMHSSKYSPFHDFDGLVVFNKKNQIEKDFRYSSFLKELCMKYKMYVYEPYPKNFSYWKTLGAAGLLVDISNRGRVNKDEL